LSLWAILSKAAIETLMCMFLCGHAFATHFAKYSGCVIIGSRDSHFFLKPGIALANLGGYNKLP
jgi:hypothetical protein